MQTAQTTTLDTLDALDIPAGFKPRFFGEGFISANGPLYTRRTEAGMQMGFRVETRHCNPMQICHGGMMATFCDMLLPMTAMVLSKDLDSRFLPTITLQVDYLGQSPLGAWVQGEAQILRTTRSLVFMQGLVQADGAPVARVSGIFKIGAVFAGFQPLAAAGTQSFELYAKRAVEIRQIEDFPRSTLEKIAKAQLRSFLGDEAKDASE